MHLADLLSCQILLSFFPAKIPKTGQADAQQGNPFILRGIMALKKPASFVPRSASVLLLKPELLGT